MDEPTQSFYAAFAPELAEQYEAAQPEVETLLRAAFRPGMRVLDVGAGVGRDVGFLLDLGCDAYGVEPCAELRALALERHPRLEGRLEAGALPRLGRPFRGDFDGVLCSGVLSHVPGAVTAEALDAIAGVLKPGGKLLLTVPLEPLDADERHRDRHGRLVTPLPPEELQSLLEASGLCLFDRWDFRDPENRKGHSWCGVLAQRIDKRGG